MKITEAMSGRDGAVIYHEFGMSWFVASSETFGFVDLVFFTQDKIGYWGPKGVARCLFRRS